MRTRFRAGAPRSHRAPEGPRAPTDSGSETTAEALSAAGRGDLRAWSWIIRQYQELVFRSAYLTARDSALAEQTTKDAFVRAHRSLGTLGDDELRAWLLRLTDTVTRSRLREQVRQRDARVPEVEPIRRLGATPIPVPPGTPVPWLRERGALIEAIDALDDKDRTVLAARYAFGLGRDAAASRMGLESEAVESVLTNALSRLRGHATEAALRSEAHDVPQSSHLAADPNGGLAPATDDQLGAMAMVAVFSELPWTPDVEPLVRDRLERDAMAYPASAIVPDSPPTPAAPVGAAATTLAPARPGSRRVRRAAGLLGVAATLVVALGLGVGWADQLDLDGTDVPAGLTALLAETTPPSDTLPRADAGSRTPTRPSPAAVDAAPGPASSEARPWVPDLSVVGVRWQDDGSLNAVVRVAWPDGLDPAAAARVRLEQRAGDRRWTQPAWNDASEPLVAVVKPGKPYRFRVRIADSEGQERISAESGVRLLVRGPRSAQLVRSEDGWGTARRPDGNRPLVAVEPGARVRTEFNGTNVALIGEPGTTAGSVGMRVDDGAWDDEPAAGMRLGRSVLFSQDLDRGRHSLDVRALAHGLTVDAILILHALRA